MAACKCLLIGLSALVCCVSGDFLLERKSFSIRSSVKRTDRYDRTTTYSIEENYSSSQRRAKIRRYMPDGSRVDFHYDAATKSALRYTEFGHICHEANLDLLWKEMFVSFVDAPVLPDLMAKSGTGIEHIVGPARLLFLIRSMKHTDPIDRGTVKNHGAVMFAIDVPQDKPGERASLFVHYVKIEGEQDYLNNQVPSSIWVSDGTMITFDQPRFLADTIACDQESANQISIDTFAFPSAKNCSNQLAGGLSKSLFDPYKPESTRLSFRAKTVVSTGLNPSLVMDHFVAYDGIVGMLRLDSKSSTDQGQIRLSRDIYDFRSRRRHSTYDEPERVVEQMHNVLPRVKQDRCIATYITQPSSRGAGNLVSYAEFLIGSSKFVYLGKAQVRGIAAKVYETSSLAYPRWLFPWFVYLDKSGNYVARECNFHRGKVDSSPFRSLIYFDSYSMTSTTGIKLLAWQVYPEMEPSPILETNFYGFAWNLEDSPSGTRSDHLFDLHEMCAESVDKYSEVDLLLADDPKHPTAVAVGWPTNSLTRNLALRAGIGDVLEISGSTIFDLESRQHKQLHYQLGVKFRVAEHPQTRYDMKFAGFGHRLAASFELPQIPSISRDYCLYLIASRRPNRGVLMMYDEKNKFCLYDLDVSDPNQSQFMSLSNSFTSEIYLIKPEQDTELSLENSLLRESKFEQLENRLVILQTPNTRSVLEYLDENQLKLRIKRVDLKFTNFETKKGEQSIRVIRGLTIDPTDALSTRVDLSKDSAKIDAHRVEPTLARCEAACFSDPTCKSFSFCNRWPDFQCIMSQVNYANETNLKYMSKSADLSDVGLQKDLKCSVHPKRYLDMFWEAELTLRQSLDGLDVSIVASAEECAATCFRRTLESLAQSSSMNRRISQLIKENNYEEIQSIRDAYLKAKKDLVCDQFYFFGESMSDNQRSSLKQLGLVPDVQSDERINICSIPNYQSNVSSSEARVDFDVQVYRMDFFNLYEKRINLKIHQADLDESSWKSQRAIRNGKADERDFRLLLKTLNEGKNLKTTLTLGNARDCAKTCFMQLSGLWPLCRSFETSTLYHDNEQFLTSCSLNTASLQTVTGNDSIQVMSADNHETVLFEPRFEFTSGEVESLDWVRSDAPVRESLNSGHLLVPICATLLGLISGLVATFVVSRQLHASKSEQDMSEIALVDTATRD